MKKDGIDNLPADAGGAAAATAGEFIDSMFGGGVDADPGEAAPQAPQASGGPAPETEEDPGFLGGFKPIDPAPEKPAAPPLPPVVDEVVPDHVVRKGADAIKTWKDLRAKVDESERRAADIERDRLLKEQELEELKKKLESAPSAEEIEALKRQLQEKEDFIGQVDVTRSKVFQETYNRPLDELFAKTVRTLEKTGHDHDSSLALARKVFRPGMNDAQKLEQELPDEPATTIGSLMAILDDRDVFAQKRDEAIANWRQTAEASRLEEQRRTSTEIGQQLTRVAEQAFDAVSKDGSWLYQRGQDPKWNEGVEARRNAAIGYIRAGKPEDLARLVFEGIASPVYRKGYEQLKAKYDELKGKYEAIANRGRPSLSGHAPAPADVPSRVAQAPASVGQAVDQLWAEN